MQVIGAEKLPWRAVVEGVDAAGKSYGGIYMLGGLALYTTPPNAQPASSSPPKQRLYAASAAIGNQNIRTAKLFGRSASRVNQVLLEYLSGVEAVNRTNLFLTMLSQKPAEMVIAQRISSEVVPPYGVFDMPLVEMVNDGATQARIREKWGISPSTISNRLRRVCEQLPISPEELTESETSVVVGTVAILAGMPPYDNIPVAKWREDNPLTIWEYAPEAGRPLQQVS